MTDTIVWLEKLPDIIKKWILIVPVIIAAIGSSTGIYQYLDKQDVIEEKNHAIHEVAQAFQKTLTELEPKKIESKPQSNCGICQTLINKHEGRFH